MEEGLQWKTNTPLLRYPGSIRDLSLCQGQLELFDFSKTVKGGGMIPWINYRQPNLNLYGDTNFLSIFFLEIQF